MTVKYKTATREGVTVFVGLAGPSGSGKTYSALRIATGLAQGKPVFMLDTEARRGLHYADKFKFMHGELTEPFNPGRYEDAIREAKKAGAAVIVVDSMSHEHEGAGGVLDMHEAEMERMAGQDWAKRERVKFAAWIKPKRERNALINFILQIGLHCVFCFRAKEKIALVKDERGKQQPVALGWQPIVGDRFEYEMTALLMLPPGSKGVPDMAASKMQDQLLPFFKNGAQVDEDMGARLAAWAAGKNSNTGDGAASRGNAPASPPPPAAPSPPAGGGDSSWPLKRMGAEVARHAKASDWLTALLQLMKSAGAGDGAVAVWDENSDTYHAILGGLKKAASIQKCRAVGAEAQRLMAGAGPTTAQGDLLGGKAA